MRDYDAKRVDAATAARRALAAKERDVTASREYLAWLISTLTPDERTAYVAAERTDSH